MKIAIVGCGALGSYYGAKLCRDGHETHFLLRSDYEVVHRDGVRIHSVDGDFQVRPQCAMNSSEIGPVDLVIIGMKTTGNAALQTLLPPLLGPKTDVLTLQNGLGTEVPVASLAGAERVMGGMCYVCINRLAPGEIHHYSGGLIVMGEYQRPPNERTHVIADMLRHAGIQVKVAQNLELAHWEKLVWNIPFNGLGVAACAGLKTMTDVNAPVERRGPCLPTDQLLSDPGWEKLVREVMLEIIAAANAQGLALPLSLADKQIALTRKLGSYKASTLMDFDRGLPLELDGLFLEPLRRAQAVGISVPVLSRLCEVLEKLTK
jgi:2-dehydropantoate 2-reductase